jgi:hypothetical protein
LTFVALNRTWKQSTAQNGQVAQMMAVFVGSSVGAHIIMSKFFYSAWPFDNLCKKDGEFAVCGKVRRGFTLELGGEEPYERAFLRDFYQWTFVILVVGAFLYMAIFNFQAMFASLFHAVHRDTKGASEEKFVHQRSIKLYVPELVTPIQVNPLLACDMSSVNPRHLGWVGDFEENNLFTYAQKQTDADISHMFSVCKQFYQYDDRLAHWTTKIQRARRSKLAIRQGQLDEESQQLALLEEEKFQTRAKQTNLDMERLESAIRAAEKAQLESKEQEESQGNAHAQRLDEMNAKLKSLGALDDVSDKLDKLQKLDHLEQLGEMHGKLVHLDKLSGIDEIHGKLKNLEGVNDKLEQLSQMNGKLEQLGDMSAKLDQLHHLEGLGEVGANLQSAFSDSTNKLEQRLSTYTDSQIGDLKAELAATRESQQQLLDAVKDLKDSAAVRAVRDQAHHEAALAAVAAANSQAPPRAAPAPAAAAPRAAPAPRAVARTARRASKRPTKKATAAPGEKSDASKGETFFCIVGQGPADGEEQQVVITPAGVHVTSINRSVADTKLAWADIVRWRLELQDDMSQGVGFEFETEHTKFPFRHPTTERAVAMLKIFQEACTMHVACYQLSDQCEQEDDDETILLLNKSGVAVKGGATICSWEAVAQWNLEPGEPEDDGTCGMDLFEFWVLEGNGEETEYAFECDGIDATYLKAGFELNMKEGEASAPSMQRQRVIV